MHHTKSDLFKPVTPKRASDSISNQIKELIYSGALKPEDRLPSERELAVTFQTGRMTVREALRMLEESGFISVKQGADGGTFIKELDASGMTKTITDLVKVGNVNLKELTEARVGIELIILDAVIKNITDEQIELLRRNIADCTSSMEDGNPGAPKTGLHLIKFHLLLASFAQNGLLRYFLQSIVDLSTDYIQRYAPQTIRTEDHVRHHQAIFEGVKNKNITQARDALKKHLYSVSENVDLAMRGTKVQSS